VLSESLNALRDQSIAPPRVRVDALRALTEVYEKWEAAEPGKGHVEKAILWRAKLDQEGL